MDTLKELHGICADLYRITGIKAVVYDADMKIVYSHPETMGTFCTAIRRLPALCAECIACDRAGFEKCRTTKDICIYQCHMGLTEAIAPIMDNGMVTGYLMFGQLLSEGTKETVFERIARLSEAADKPLLREEIERMAETDDEKIRAAARLIGMCSEYIRLRGALKAPAETPEMHIDRYIRRQMSNPSLSPAALAAEMNISRGTLYNRCKAAFGMGASEYIRALRLGEAERLLKETDLPVYEIAARVGIEDANYLAKLLKQRTGLTPKQLRSEAEK